MREGRIYILLQYESDESNSMDLIGNREIKRTEDRREENVSPV